MASRSSSSSRSFLAGVALLSTASQVLADGSVNKTISDALGGMGKSAEPASVTIFIAQKVVTMESGIPYGSAVAIDGKRILSVGSLEQVKAALGNRQYKVDDTFKSKVIMPGFIDQHLHPILGALTLAVEVVAPEDWVLPGVVHKAANSNEEYLARLKKAEAKLKNPNEWLLTWGYHALWHGKLDRAALDQISATRPIAVWHRSCHEFYLNAAGLKALGITEEMTKNKGQFTEQSNWQEGHFWEGGLHLMIGPMLKVLATPDRLAFGLKQMVAYEHANGVTAYNEPGALYTPGMWQLYEKILGAPDTPMYSTFIADGRGIVDRVGLDGALDATEAQMAMAPEGPGRKLMFFPKQIKLFADGAIISQLMEMKDGYLDGHKGEWIIPPDELERRARLFWNAGYQIHTHVNGDLGLEKLLGILEKLNQEHPRPDHRSVIVHFANSTEDQVARIKRLGAIVSTNPYYVTGFADKFSEVGVGPQRADTMVRAKSVLDQGISLSYHSDLPMAPSNPLDAAYSWRKEDQIGSIAPGKIANFTILDQDPYAVDPVKLKDVSVWGTVFEGRVFPVPANDKKADYDRGPAAPRYAAAPIRLLTRFARSPSADPCDLVGLSRAAVLTYDELVTAR